MGALHARGARRAGNGVRGFVERGVPRIVQQTFGRGVGPRCSATDEPSCIGSIGTAVGERIVSVSPHLAPVSGDLA